MKKISKILIIISFFLIMAPNNAMAINDGQGPYTINIKTMDNETKENISGSYFKIIKTHNLKKDGSEEKIDKPIDITPVGMKNPEFQINGETTVNIPRNTGKGIYKVVETKRAPGYYPYKGDIEIEFPKIKNGKYEESQLSSIDIELNKIKAGFVLQVFAENKVGEVDTYNNPLRLELYRISPSGNRIHVNTISYSSVDENKVKELTEGKYEMTIGEVSLPGVIQPKSCYTFEVRYDADINSPILVDTGYDGFDSASEINDVSYRLYLYADPVIDIHEEKARPKIKKLVGNYVEISADIYATNVIRNFNNVRVRIPTESKALSITEVQGAKLEGDYYVMPITEHGVKSIRVKALVKDSSPILSLPIELIVSDEYTFLNKTKTLFDDYEGVYGKLQGTIKIKEGFFKSHNYTPKGRFVFISQKDQTECGEVKVKGDKIEVNKLPVGEYKINYISGSGEKISTEVEDELPNITISEDASIDRLVGIYIDTDLTLVSKKYNNLRLTVYSIVGIAFIAWLVFDRRLKEIIKGMGHEKKGK